MIKRTNLFCLSDKEDLIRQKHKSNYLANQNPNIKYLAFRK